MQLELWQLDRKYEEEKVRDPHQEARLLGSLEREGQQQAVVVIAAEGGRYVLVDGYRRVRALEKLKRDVAEFLRGALGGNR